jgi:hypothetical protein
MALRRRRSAKLGHSVEGCPAHFAQCVVVRVCGGTVHRANDPVMQGSPCMAHLIIAVAVEMARKRGLGDLTAGFTGCGGNVLQDDVVDTS